MPILLQINPIVNARSTGRIVEELGQIAMEDGWVSYIAYGRKSRPSKSKVIKIGTPWDIKLHGLKSRLFDGHGFGTYDATLKLVEQITALKPDIIHLHNLHGYYLNIEVLFKFLATVETPVIWTLHDCWSMTGHCSYFDFVGCEKWKTGCYSCPQQNEYPSCYGFDRSTKNYKLKKELFTSSKRLTIVPVSQWLCDIVKQSFLKSYPVQVINNGIDIKTFSPQNRTEEIRYKYGIGNRFMLMGVATAWSKSKGIDDYYKLSESLPDDCVIVLVGLTKNQIQILPKKIIGLLRTDNALELAQLYSAADIVLNLSYQEAFGLTTVEGFACGTPGIVYNCTASPELVTQDTGIIVEKGNIQGVIIAIKTIRKKGKFSFSSACRQRVEKFYNKDDRFMDYLNLYKSILNKNTK